MKLSTRYLCLLNLFILLISMQSIADVECKGGGDSGTPFVDISKEFNVNAKLVKTPGLIKDFIVRENTAELVYRTEDNDVWRATSKSIDFISHMQTAFSKILDPWNSYIISKSTPWVLSTYNKRWYPLGNKEKRGQDLYWEGSRVFSVETPDYSKQTIWYNIQHVNGGTQRLSCSLSFPKDVEVHVGNSGHTYPYLFLYTTQEFPEGTKVVKYALRLEAKKKIIGEIPRCELTSLNAYKNLMPGKVKALYHFGNLEDTSGSAWLMDIENPKKRLLWSFREQCTYFNAPISKIMIPNPQVPVVAMQREEGGIKLFYPWVEKSVDILEKMVTRPISGDNIYLTRDRKNLYVAAQPENENARLLFKVALDQVQ